MVILGLDMCVYTLLYNKTTFPFKHFRFWYLVDVHEHRLSITYLRTCFYTSFIYVLAYIHSYILVVVFFFNFFIPFSYLYLYTFDHLLINSYLIHLCQRITWTSCIRWYILYSVSYTLVSYTVYPVYYTAMHVYNVYLYNVYILLYLMINRISLCPI